MTDAYLVDTTYQKDGTIIKTIDKDPFLSCSLHEQLFDIICQMAGVYYDERIDFVEISVEDGYDILETFDFSNTPIDIADKFKELIRSYDEDIDDYIEFYCY